MQNWFFKYLLSKVNSPVNNNHIYELTNLLSKLTSVQQCHNSIVNNIYCQNHFFLSQYYVVPSYNTKSHFFDNILPNIIIINTQKLEDVYQNTPDMSLPLVYI